MYMFFDSIEMILFTLLDVYRKFRFCWTWLDKKILQNKVQLETALF